MATITDSDGWVPVTRPETTDIALGGNETNFPGKFFRELASRDQYLYETALGGDATSIASAVAFRQLGIAAVAQGRLTLETGVPVSTTDQTAKTVLYYTPYSGDYVALYDTVNTRWDLFQFTERSLSLSGLAANTNYDIFIYNNSGTLTLQAVAWATSGAGTSTRASAITQLEGVWVKDSDKRRYLGTIRTTSVAGECEDSALKRYVWNVYNREFRLLDVADATSHTYTSTTLRQWNNSFLGVSFVIGLDVTVTIEVAVTLDGGVVFCVVNGCDQATNTGTFNSRSTITATRSLLLLYGSEPLFTRPAGYRGVTFGYNTFEVYEGGGLGGANQFTVARLLGNVQS
ncbi:MAG: hypothetical protein ACO3S8_04995 [Aquiluna sp.]